MWKSMIEDFLTINDLSNTLEDEETPKDIFDLKWKTMSKPSLQ